MKLAGYGKSELRVSLPVMLLLPAAALFSRLETLFVVFVSLMIHEFSHAVMARRLGIGISRVELQPFGFIAEFAREPSPSEEAAIAACGPIISLLAALSSAGLLLLLPDRFACFPPKSGAVYEFSVFNLTLGCFNLLPALPLDGGRLVLALISRGASYEKRRRRAALFCFFGMFFGCAIAALGIAFEVDAAIAHRPVEFGALSFIITGGYLALAASRAKRELSSSRAKQQLALSSRLSRGSAARVFSVAMNASCTVRDALKAVSGSGFGVVFVTDENLRTLGVIDEGALTDAAIKGGSDLPLSSLINC